MLEQLVLSKSGIAASRVPIDDKAVAIWIVDLHASGDIAPHYWDVLSTDEKERTNRFRRSDDRIRFSLTRMSLRFLLAEEMNVDPNRLQFATRDQGKPYLVHAPYLNFNVSHSRNIAAIGISKNRAIGIDVEHIDKTLDELALAQPFFSPAEVLFLSALKSDDRSDAFFRIWTCKEAVLKAYGFGIGEYLQDFSVLLSPDNLQISAALNSRLPFLSSVQVRPFPVPQGFSAAVAFI